MEIFKNMENLQKYGKSSKIWKIFKNMENLQKCRLPLQPFSQQPLLMLANARGWASGNKHNLD